MQLRKMTEQDRQNILDFQDAVCGKRGNLHTLHTLWENRNMILYVVENVMGLSEEEFRNIYSIELNKTVRISKYIAKIVELKEAKEHDVIFVGKHTRDLIFSVIYPDSAKPDNRKEIIRRLNNEEGALINYLQKVKTPNKRTRTVYLYLDWLLHHVFCIKTVKDVYEFLADAEKIDMGHRIKALSLTYLDYGCLMDLFFFNLPPEKQPSHYYWYMQNRKKIDVDLDIIEMFS